MSLIAYPFLQVPKNPIKVGAVSVATPEHIAVMKITAVSQRGKKRDFVDLYWISKNIQPLEQSIQSVLELYSIKQNENHILKSLVFFEDAESDPMPVLHFEVKWEDVKKFFQTEVPRIAKKIIGIE